MAHASHPEHAHTAGMRDEGGLIEIQVIETLMTALSQARLTTDPMLPRLIEAVLLHAGRELAKSLAMSGFEDGAGSSDMPVEMRLAGLLRDNPRTPSAEHNRLSEGRL